MEAARSRTNRRTHLSGGADSLRLRTRNRTARAAGAIPGRQEYRRSRNLGGSNGHSSSENKGAVMNRDLMESRLISIIGSQ